MGGKSDPGKVVWERGTEKKMALITFHLGPHWSFQVSRLFELDWKLLRGIEKALHDLKGPRSWRRGGQMLKKNCGEGSCMEDPDPGEGEDKVLKRRIMEGSSMEGPDPGKEEDKMLRRGIMGREPTRVRKHQKFKRIMLEPTRVKV